MNKICLKGLLTIFCLFAFCAVLLHGENVTQQNNFKNDSVNFLKDEIAFHVSFDLKNVRPDIGTLKVEKTGENLKYAPGLYGQALVISDKPEAAVEYQPITPLFQGSGSICFWVMPKSWIKKGTLDSRGLITFLRATIGQGAMIVMRQGYSTEPKRRDYLLALLNKVTEGMPLAIGDTTEKWENGIWHLIVINWNEKGFDISIDGKEFKHTMYPRSLNKSDFHDGDRFGVAYGYSNSPEKTLIDEITAFKRPLTLSEIRKIYKTGLANIKNDVLPAEEEGGVAVVAPAKVKLGASWNNEVVKTEARLPFISKNELPKIDGKINEKEWNGALKVIGGYKNEFHLDSRECIYYLASDSKKIYIAIRSELPPNKKLIANNPPQGDKDIPQVCNDDSVEIWLMPDKKSGQKMYCIIANYLGAIYDFAYNAKTKEINKSWRANAEFASKIVGNEWHVEIAIPVNSLNRTVVEENLPYGIHIVRNFNLPRQQANWTPFIGAFNNPDNMGIVTWDNAAPLVRYASTMNKNEREIDLTFEAVNKGEDNISLNVNQYWESAGNTDNISSNRIVLQAGEKQKFTLVKDTAIGGQYFVLFNAVSPDNSKTYFTRKFIWQTMRGDDVWMIESSKSDVRFWYAYYPYYNKIKTKIDISNTKNKAAVAGALVRLSDKNNKAVIVEASYPPFNDSVSEFTFNTPVLKEGEYLIEAFIMDNEGKKHLVESKKIKRKIFEWEGNDLGISDEVIPPFTPLQVSGKNVDAVLRTHFLNDIGLPEQIKSDGKNILAGPISLLIEVDGKKETIRVNKPLSFIAKKKNEVSYETSWEAGSLNGKITAFFDYDGMLKIKLDLSLPEKATLSRCDLIIPVTPETAKLTHILSDTGKASFTGKVPSGINPVWESLFIDRNPFAGGDQVVSRLPGTFIPYIWIGDECRGISWFANSDKGWLTNDRESAVKINRYENRTDIVVRFVTRPGRLKGTHSIVFALQATPTKPMPKEPAPWRNIVFNMPQLKKQYNASFIGSAFQWGGDDYYTFYPRNKDYSIFKLISDSRKGEHDATAWEKWSKGYDQNIPFVKRLERNIGTGMSYALSRPQSIIPYTNMRGVVVREEDFKVFQDEWLLYEYSPKKFPEYDESGIFGYDAIACRSRQDYIMWYFNKMLESGAMDAIYYDVTYPKAIRDTVSGNAYYDETGKIRAACDLFETRELFKRSAVLAWQKRKYNLNIAHMSFTLIAPVHSWTGAILDWETRYGMDDFQDRFNREYIRAVSLGRQVGATPFALGSLGIRGDADRRAWVNRTLTGVLVTHEIKDWALGWGKDKIYEDTLKTMYDFGYGTAACSVYNYWNEDFPVFISGIDYSAIMLVKDEEVLIVVCDYGEGGICKLTLDPQKVKIKSGGEFIDMQSGKKLDRNGNYTCSFQMKKHDFKVILYR